MVETLVATSTPADTPRVPPRHTRAEERLDLGLLQSLAEDGHRAQVTLQRGGAAPLCVLAASRRRGHHPLGGGLSGGPGVRAQGGGDRLGATERRARGEDQLWPVGHRGVAGGGGGGGGGPVACGADAAGGEGLEGRRREKESRSVPSPTPWGGGWPGTGGVAHLVKGGEAELRCLPQVPVSVDADDVLAKGPAAGDVDNVNAVLGGHGGGVRHPGVPIEPLRGMGTGVGMMLTQAESLKANSGNATVI